MNRHLQTKKKNQTQVKTLIGLPLWEPKRTLQLPSFLNNRQSAFSQWWSSKTFMLLLNLIPMTILNTILETTHLHQLTPIRMKNISTMFETLQVWTCIMEAVQTLLLILPQSRPLLTIFIPIIRLRTMEGIPSQFSTVITLHNSFLPEIRMDFISLSNDFLRFPTSLNDSRIWKKPKDEDL